MSKFSAIFGGAPKGTALTGTLPPAPPPPPTTEDPSVSARAREVRQYEKQRKGRAATVLTPSSGAALGDTPVNRPGLRNTEQLGS